MNLSREEVEHEIQMDFALGWLADGRGHGWLWSGGAINYIYQ
jgi:hypothetical protein